jgi:mRNA-degrading endonuclease HigB of HigAB toxin-antitoxin module
MRVIGKQKLTAAKGDVLSRRWIACWTTEVSQAHWKRPGDVRLQFPKCREAKDGSFVFPILEGPHAVRAVFQFPIGVALILGITQIDQA